MRKHGMSVDEGNIYNVNRASNGFECLARNDRRCAAIYRRAIDQAKKNNAVLSLLEAKQNLASLLLTTSHVSEAEKIIKEIVPMMTSGILDTGRFGDSMVELDGMLSIGKGSAMRTLLKVILNS